MKQTLIVLALSALAFMIYDDIATSMKAKDDAIRELATHMGEQTKLLNTFVIEMQNENRDREKIQKDLEHMKGRTEAFLAKPTVTEAMIDKSFSSFEARLACITGFSEHCSQR